MKSTYGQHPIKKFSELQIMDLLRTLWPYLTIHRWRVISAVLLLVGGKLASLSMPWALKQVVDSLDSHAAQVVVIPVLLVLLYGLLRFGAVLLGELRDAVFSRVTESAMRKSGLAVFANLHQLELDFHLSRQTGGMSRDIDRGTRGINFLMRFMVFNILPTLFELIIVAIILLVAFNIWFAAVTLVCVAAYVCFSIITTEWRTQFVRAANQLDSESNTRAIDSLLNYETVKYFNNESHEWHQYDHKLTQWEQARINNRLSLAVLNTGQALIITLGITGLLYLAAKGVVDQSMTLGDLVMVNAYMLQLFIPLNALGFIYREIRRALSDVENMFNLLKRKPAIADQPLAPALKITQAAIEFDQVSFAYNNNRIIFDGFNFSVATGEKVAIVGRSGIGKSTVVRLLFRFYDVTGGTIRIDGQDIRTVQQLSLRQSIGVVPQDTVLFNDTIWNNIAYGHPDADTAAIWRAIEMAYLSDFIKALPKQEHTKVGERGLKVSGGEKQRIAIARVLLKNPAILLFDEATSALDSQAERSILTALEEISHHKTTLIIAHRLSTIVDADRILVIDQGQVMEQGKHTELLAQQGLYAHLWQLQQQ
jgi:ABC-type transport system involved in Fe-S cluster assembly fused permease/ATPase subunit